MDLQVAVTLSHAYGWRTQSEAFILEQRCLDLELGTFRLDPGTTRNDDGRVVYLTSELKVMLKTQMARVDELGWQLVRIIPYLFPHLKGKLKGSRRKDFRKPWKTACTKPGARIGFDIISAGWPCATS